MWVQVILQVYISKSRQKTSSRACAQYPETQVSITGLPPTVRGADTSWQQSRQRGSPMVRGSAATMLILEASLETSDPFPKPPRAWSKDLWPLSLSATAQRCWPAGHRPAEARLPSVLVPCSRDALFLILSQNPSLCYPESLIPQHKVRRTETGTLGL